MAVGIEQDKLHWIPPVPANDDYPGKFQFKCVETIEELKSLFDYYKKEDGNYPLMGFDTETTGLNPEEDYIVGYSFAFNGVQGYYVPIEHINLALGKEALDMVYDVMCKSEKVLMYNARFDIRMLEWYKFGDESFEFKKNFIANARQHYCYDMDKVKVYDVQVMVWAMDTAHYMPKLKWAELQFLGWRSNTFAETEGDAANFGMLDPRDPVTYQYAATDAVALILLYNLPIFERLREEANLSLQMHAEGKMIPLTRFEETPINADVELLKKQSEYFHNQLNDIEKRIYNIVGYEFNISSGPSRAKAFKDKNIIITETTASGAIATGASVLEDVQKQFDKESEQYILIDLCIEYLHLKKMLSTYVDSLLDQVTKDSPDYRIGLYRYSYRLNSTVSGRYSLADVHRRITDNFKDLSLYERINSKEETVKKYEDKLSINSGKLLGVYRKIKDNKFKHSWLLVHFENCGHICLIRNDSNFKCQQKNCHDKYFSESQTLAKNKPEWKQFCKEWNKKYYSDSKNREYHSQRTKEGMHEDKHWNNFLIMSAKRFSEPSEEFLENYINGRIKEQRRRANKDELKFLSLLQNAGVLYTWQKGLYDEENNKMFIVDFYLPEFDLYIEIDGGSHRRVTKIERDMLLDNYCIKNKISLIHITPEQIDCWGGRT